MKTRNKFNSKIHVDASEKKPNFLIFNITCWNFLFFQEKEKEIFSKAIFFNAREKREKYF